MMRLVHDLTERFELQRLSQHPLPASSLLDVEGDVPSVDAAAFESIPDPYSLLNWTAILYAYVQSEFQNVRRTGWEELVRLKQPLALGDLVGSACTELVKGKDVVTQRYAICTFIHALEGDLNQQTEDGKPVDFSALRECLAGVTHDKLKDKVSRLGCLLDQHAKITSTSLQ